MEEFDKARDDLLLAAAHARLLADLLLPHTDLQDVDRANFALVMQDLASRLERDLARFEECLRETLGKAEERA